MNPGIVVGILFAILGVVLEVETFHYVLPAWMPEWTVVAPIWLAATGAALVGSASSKVGQRINWLPFFQISGGGLMTMGMIMSIMTPVAIFSGLIAEPEDMRTPFVLPMIIVSVGFILMLAATAIYIKRMRWMHDHKGQNVVNGRPWY